MRLVNDIRAQSSAIWRPFIFNVAGVVLIFILSIFLGLISRNRHLINTELLMRARAHFDTLIVTRQWNAQHGGVFVEKDVAGRPRPRFRPSEITTTDGAVYSDKTPATMTREISEVASKEGTCSFRLVSLNAQDPANEPDDFERGAISELQAGVAEVHAKQSDGDRVFFRYLAPLAAEPDSMQGPGGQKPRAGDGLAAISVRFDITDIERSLQATTRFFVLLGIMSSVALFGVIYVSIRKVMRALEQAQEVVHTMAMTDELTEMFNRRYFYSVLNQELQASRRYRRNLSCLMFDLDYFKRVNDEHGHAAGDHVLQRLAEILRSKCRGADTIARYGGEEFIALLPETDEKGAAHFAERIRRLVEQTLWTTPEGTALSVTISIGVAGFTPDQLEQIDDADLIVRPADDALYLAKQKGRNRVERCHEHHQEKDRTLVPSL